MPSSSAKRKLEVIGGAGAYARAHARGTKKQRSAWRVPLAWGPPPASDAGADSLASASALWTGVRRLEA
jgi:hypothetical protein